MKKLALLLSLTVISAACAKTELEVLKEKHAKALEEVVPHLDDMWNETITTESNGVNYTWQNGLGTSHTTHTTTKTNYNTPEAGRAHNIYKKALAPFTNKLFWRDLGVSVSAGVIATLLLIDQQRKAGKGVFPNHVGKILAASLLIPGLQVILGNLTEEEMKYLNDRTLSVHDNLYKNLSWYTAERVVGNTGVSGLTTIATVYLALIIAGK